MQLPKCLFHTGIFGSPQELRWFLSKVKICSKNQGGGEEVIKKQNAPCSCRERKGNQEQNLLPQFQAWREKGRTKHRQHGKLRFFSFLNFVIAALPSLGRCRVKILEWARI